MFSASIPQAKQLEMIILVAIWWNIAEIEAGKFKLSLLSIFSKT